MIQYIKVLTHLKLPPIGNQLDADVIKGKLKTVDNTTTSASLFTTSGFHLNNLQHLSITRELSAFDHDKKLHKKHRAYLKQSKIVCSVILLYKVFDFCIKFQCWINISQQIVGLRYIIVSRLFCSR